MCVLFRTPYLKARCVQLLFTGDVNFDHLMMELSYLHSIVIFSLACNKQSVDRYFETMQIFCSSSKAPTLAQI